MLSSNGKAKANAARAGGGKSRVARSRITSTQVARGHMARDWVARGPLCSKKSQEGQESESIVLRTYIGSWRDEGEGVTF